MIIQFPNLETLQLALTTGTIPESICLGSAKAHFGDEGEVWVEPQKGLTKQAATALDQLGVKLYKRAGIELDVQVTCWPQLLPAVRRTESPRIGPQTPVLFELLDAVQLPELVNEVLRQGNDRQGFRHLTNGAEAKSLLRVIGPPYYSLLRAIDGKGSGMQPRAYIEHNAGVWVELGYEHPLAATVQPPAGKWLFMRPNRDWAFVDEGHFQDVYSVLDFALRSDEAAWQESKREHRISVPLRLSTSSTKEVAELWVLRDGGLDQVERLVRNADDRLVAQLSFAVAEDGDEPTVILRARPARTAPPVLVLEGVSFRSYLKLPNLFVPVGSRLHPPLRRDAVAKLFQQDGSRFTWLYPEEQGGFTPQSIEEDAFRPLADWVDYIIDRNHEALQAWVSSYRFDFESFVCKDDKRAKPRPNKRQSHEPKPVKQTTNVKKGQAKAEGEESDSAAALEMTSLLEADRVKPEPNEMQLRLRGLEQRYEDSDEPIDAPERSRLWREMGAINALLRHRHDATVCWSNGLWEEAAPSAASLDSWLKSEGIEHDAQDTRIDDLLLWIDDPTTPAHASKVAAYLVAVAKEGSLPKELIAQLGAISQYLERQEAYLPIRTAWLAWLAVVRLSNGDLLTLARARDRLLERLYQHGLRAEFDLPTFLRAGGNDDSDRFRVIREHVLKVHKEIYDWIKEPPSGGSARTKAYADLLFAFALARLGETAQCRRLTTGAEEGLKGDDPVHKWLRTALGQRINEALDGTSFQDPLDSGLMERLASMDRLDRYKIDRLRQHSHILEPHERIDPYRRWHRRYEDDLSRQLAELHDVTNRDDLRDAVATLVRQTSKDSASAVRVLNAALELAPRMGDAAAQELLKRILPTFNATKDSVEKSLLLTRGMLISAHYGAVDYVHAFVAQFERLLSPIVTTFLTVGREHHPEDKDKVDTLEDLFKGSFRGLRRLGMRDEVGRLFGQTSEIVARQVKHADRSKKRGRKPDQEKVRIRARRLLLTVAGGWFYFGQNEQATAVVDEVRSVLFEGKYPAIEQRNLACAYVTAVGQAPSEIALPLILELFETAGQGRRKLAGIEDAMTTSSHFSISQLDLIESVVLTLVSDDFSLNADSRRWLDEDEFLVRRRIHRDMEEAMK